MPDDPTPETAPAEAAVPQVDAASELAKPRPQGEPEAVVALREMIEAKLSTLGGYLVDNHGSYVVGMQSARAFVVPTWLENGMTVVRVFAITNLDVPVTAELTRWLLQRNLEFVFGAFALDVDNGAVWFNHNLLGGYAAPEELEATIGAVIETADRFDDEIKAQFGGRLYVEAEGEKVTPPTAPGYL